MVTHVAATNNVTDPVARTTVMAGVRASSGRGLREGAPTAMLGQMARTILAAMTAVAEPGEITMVASPQGVVVTETSRICV